MLLGILRALFLLAFAAVAMSFAESGDPWAEAYAFPMLIGALGFGVLVLTFDIFMAQKSLSAFSGLFFGLAVGLLIAYAVILIFNLFLDTVQPSWRDHDSLINSIKICIGVLCCYLSVSFILQTKDDIRFIIPYVEFAKQTKGGHPLLLDTSAIVDGRFADICETGIVDAPIVVPRFVLNELQTIADSSDRLKRNRGRRGLDVLQRLQTNEKLDVKIQETRSHGEQSVDERLVLLAHKMDGRVVTNDYNLNKVAQLHGVDVINVNDLANALKPVFLPGERLSVKVIKPGEEAGQGVGYLDDGTMVVIESGRDYIGELVPILVTSVLQTSAGRMVFGRMEGMQPSGGRRSGRTMS